MAQILLKARLVRDIPFMEAGQSFYFDTQTQGFGLRVGKTKKAYFVEGRTRGKKCRVTLGNTEQLSLDAARKLAKKAIAEMADGINRNEAKAKERVRGITLEEAISEFFESRDLKPKTVAVYNDSLRCHFSDWNAKSLKSITPHMIVERFDLVTVTAGKAAANLAARVFRSIWNFTRHNTADKTGTPILHEHPVARLSALRKIHKPVRRQNHVKDFPAFFNALEEMVSEDFKDYMELLLRTGLRRSEAANLVWSDVDLKYMILTVRNTKNHSDHQLPMSIQIIDLFRRLKKRHSETDFVWGNAPMGDPRKSLKRFCLVYGEPFTYHDARRTFTNLTEVCGVSWLKTKRLLNHADGQDVTVGYATNRDPERLRSEMQQISDRLDEMARVVQNAHHLALN